MADNGPTNISLDPIVAVWLGLVLLSGVSFAVIEGGLVTAVASVVVVLVAAFKARLIMSHFMELKTVPRNWQVMYTGWIIAASALLLIGNFVAMVKG
jgi:cytochrome c oxidase subunit 4